MHAQKGASPKSLSRPCIKVGKVPKDGRVKREEVGPSEGRSFGKF